MDYIIRCKRDVEKNSSQSGLAQARASFATSTSFTFHRPPHLQPHLQPRFSINRTPIPLYPPSNACPSPLGLLSSSQIERPLSGSGSAQEHQHLRWSTQEGGLTHLRPRNKPSSPGSVIQSTALTIALSVRAQARIQTVPLVPTRSPESSSPKSIYSSAQSRKTRIAPSGNSRLSSLER